MSQPHAPTSLDDATWLLAHGLRDDIAVHEAGRFRDIAQRYDDVQLAVLPMLPRHHPTAELTFRFWDSWRDSARHDWLYYEGMSEADWPRLAGVIAHALEAGEAVTDPLLLRHFGPRAPLLSRLRAFLRGKRGLPPA